MKPNSVGARVREVRTILGMTQDEFAAILGIRKSALSMIENGRTTLSLRNKNILVQELNVNPDWIERGLGEMFNCPIEDFAHYLKPRDDDAIPLQSIPLYNIDKAGGLVSLFANPEKYKSTEYISIPNLPKCDGAIYLAGDGMSPLLNSGDIVLYRQLHDIEDVFWGDMYLLSIDVSGEEYITVRYIRKSDRAGYVKLVGENPLHADKEVRTDKIKAIAFVKANIRLNAMR